MLPATSDTSGSGKPSDLLVTFEYFPTSCRCGCCLGTVTISNTSQSATQSLIIIKAAGLVVGESVNV